MLNNKKGVGRPPVPYKTKLVQYRVPETEVEVFKLHVAPIIDAMRKVARFKATLNEKVSKHTAEEKE